jgi:Domain of unknown function (DUF4386)
MNMQTIKHATGILLVTEALLLFLPVFILNNAINWPISLSEPPSVMLPLLMEEAAAVRLGYLMYLVYSILIWPLAALTVYTVAGGDTLSPMLRIAAGFGSLSALARTLGIIRWLAPMPVLAQQYTATDVTPQTKASIEIVYRMLNDYGGSIGEVLGVSFFAAFWVALIGIALLRAPLWPKWLGIFALVAATLLSTAIVELFGIDLGPFLGVSVTAIQLWFLAFGLYLLISRKDQTFTEQTI